MTSEEIRRVIGSFLLQPPIQRQVRIKLKDGDTVRGILANASGSSLAVAGGPEGMRWLSIEEIDEIGSAWD